VAAPEAFTERSAVSAEPSVLSASRRDAATWASLSEARILAHHRQPEQKDAVMKREDVRFFDRTDEFWVFDRQLPHWTQAGALCFVTWRTADSMPAPVLKRLDQDIASALRSNGLSPAADWRSQFRHLKPAERARIHWQLFVIRDRYLDAGHGRCLLAKPQHAEQVLKSLRHVDEQRYFLTDVVVMPNHVHFLAAFESVDVMLDQCTNCKRFIGRKINAAERQRGEFWQVDQFDHLIRCEEEFEHYRQYIRENPLRAGLKEGRYLYWQKQL